MEKRCTRGCSRMDHLHVQLVKIFPGGRVSSIRSAWSVQRQKLQEILLESLPVDDMLWIMGDSSVLLKLGRQNAEAGADVEKDLNLQLQLGPGKLVGVPVVEKLDGVVAHSVVSGHGDKHFCDQRDGHEPVAVDDFDDGGQAPSQVSQAVE